MSEWAVGDGEIKSSLLDDGEVFVCLQFAAVERPQPLCWLADPKGQAMYLTICLTPEIQLVDCLGAEQSPARTRAWDALIR